MKAVASNRKAYHDYFIVEDFEAGIQLIGQEVKSLRAGKANLKDSYVRFKNEEAFIVKMHISRYSHATRDDDYEPERTRKILLHKREISKLMGKVKEKGLSVVPLEIFFNKRGYAKMKIALVKGKKLYDKRETIKKRDLEREMKNIKGFKA
ncbi:SsrA-binding protein SmpB [bacterium]